MQKVTNYSSEQYSNQNHFIPGPELSKTIHLTKYLQNQGRVDASIPSHMPQWDLKMFLVTLLGCSSKISLTIDAAFPFFSLFCSTIYSNAQMNS